jgi:hypothetical protein
MSEVEASGTFNLHVSDLTVAADTRYSPLNVVLCVCGQDSGEGVKIVKNSTKHAVCITADSNGSSPEVTIVDSVRKIDCILIPKEKTRPVVLKYTANTKTWLVER